ncbi:IS200/IS605 family accessory protein TnpB-related protein [Streptomyces sp. NPDC048506]|uniref:IS200/IS605 family accessory protein TnpB-related protein n=1 Tax=Streptomyces sp. NPDC048506 TaxID=3155028 RepID=UPI0034288ECD
MAIRDRLKHLTARDEDVLRAVGEYEGRLASRDLKARCTDGLDHCADSWAVRKRELTAVSSSRIAGAITKATHDQWALARRCQAAHLQNLEAGITTLRRRLSLPLGEKGTKRAAGGYRSKGEWFRKSRRLAMLEARRATVVEDWRTGRVRVVRGSRRLLNTRHQLEAAQLSEAEWRRRWEAERWFLAADGESGKRFGNETIRVTPDGEVSIKLPAPLAHLANAPHGRHTLAAKVAFAHRGGEWRDRIEGNRAVAYRIHLDVARGRWYLTASWQRPVVKTVPLAVARARGMIGVDTNADHLAAYHLDPHGNPIGDPHRFFFGLSGSAGHRDAQIRHALTRLLHWAQGCGVAAIGIEDLDFAAEKTREKHGRRTRFRQLISDMPTGKLKARLASMAAELGLAIVAVDPAYTSMWGDEHWRKPLTSGKRTMTRHDAASVAIGRRALGHPIRRRTAPPRDDRSDRRGHRTDQAEPGTQGREETRPRIPGPRTRCVSPDRGAKAGDQCAQHRSGHTAEQQFWQQDSLPLSL